MSVEEELEQLQQENTVLRESLQRKDEELQRSHQSNQDLREGIKQAIVAIRSLQEQVKDLEGQIGCYQERVKTLERQQAKDSHNSSLPPSSDRFVRPPKSLRQKSGKKPGGQQGHRGHHLRQVELPDEVLIHPVECCEHCQQDLRAHPAELPERRQIIDLPLKRLWVTEQKARRKTVPSVLSSDTRLLPSRSFGPCTVWDRHPDAGYLPGRRSGRSLRSGKPAVTGTAGSPTLPWQHRQLCQHLSPAVGRSGNPSQNRFGEAEGDSSR